MALQPIDYQSYKWDEYPLDASPCGKCDTLFYPVGDFYPVTGTIPAFQFKMLPVGDNLFSNPDFPTSSVDWALDNFEYNSGALCLNNLTDTYIPSVRQTVSQVGWPEVTHEIKFSYTNLGFPDNPFSIKMEIRDSLNNLMETQSISPVTTITKKEVTLYWETPATAETDFTFIFYLIFDNAYPITQTTGFCFDDFSLYELDEITAMGQYYVNNSPVVLTFTTQKHNDIVLVEISDLDTSINDCFRLNVITAANDEYLSNIIRVDTYGECIVDKQLLITWTDDCRFGDLDYANLPFTNSFYVKGFTARLSNNTRERIQRVNGDGSVNTVYDSSYVKYEIGIGAYTEDIHDILDRAFRHKTVTINGYYYTLDEGSNYTLVDLRSGLYTARIDLIRTGKEVVKTLCCC